MHTKSNTMSKSLKSQYIRREFCCRIKEERTINILCIFTLTVCLIYATLSAFKAFDCSRISGAKDFFVIIDRLSASFVASSIFYYINVVYRSSKAEVERRNCLFSDFLPLFCEIRDLIHICIGSNDIDKPKEDLERLFRINLRLPHNFEQINSFEKCEVDKEVVLAICNQCSNIDLKTKEFLEIHNHELERDERAAILNANQAITFKDIAYELARNGNSIILMKQTINELIWNILSQEKKILSLKDKYWQYSYSGPMTYYKYFEEETVRVTVLRKFYYTLKRSIRRIWKGNRLRRCKRCSR